MVRKAWVIFENMKSDVIEVAKLLLLIFLIYFSSSATSMFMVNCKRKRAMKKNMRNSGLSFPLTCTKILYPERLTC